MKPGIRVDLIHTRLACNRTLGIVGTFQHPGSLRSVRMIGMHDSNAVLIMRRMNESNWKNVVIKI